MTLGQHQEEFSKDLCMLILYAQSLGYGVRIREVQRTKAQQEIYYAEGKSHTKHSRHLKSLAADIYFTLNGNIVYPEELSIYWEKLDPINRAGMFFRGFKDSPHFERSA